MKINFYLYVKMKKRATDHQPNSSTIKIWNKLFLKKLLLYYSIALLLCCCFAVPVHATEISAVNVKIHDNDIYVTASVKLDSKIMNDLQEGLSKEFAFYIDLFRVWRIWPNEFVTGKRLTKNLMSNPIKREYAAVLIEGNIHTERRFRGIDSMVEWATSLQDLKLVNIRALENGTYFVRVTAESRIRRLPPVIGLFLFFVPENEFNVSKDSPSFEINHKGLQQ
jgi:hypothetical protein